MSDTINMVPQFRTIDDLKIRFADSGGVQPITVLLTSPWPESLFAYNRVWNLIAKAARLIAIDLPGFGQSERRDSLMSPHAMGEFLMRVVAEFDVTSVHLVSPDIGTAAGLFAAADHPGTFESLTVGDGGVAFPLDLGGALKDFVDAPDTKGFANLDARVMIGAAIDGMEGEPIPAAIREDYIVSYAGDRFARSADYARQYPTDLKALRDKLDSITTPVQLIRGKRDGFVPVSNEEYLLQHLPQSQLHVLDAAHFAWEEAADEYAKLVTAWVTGGYQR